MAKEQGIIEGITIGDIGILHINIPIPINTDIGKYPHSHSNNVDISILVQFFLSFYSNVNDELKTRKYDE
tara:strand:+ start:2315 stop:2524 length:210 start_codon:yes stop_codon:yes gene_type:complete